jgi:hypothetical protein
MSSVLKDHRAPINPDDWIPLSEGWRAFHARYPVIELTVSVPAIRRFISLHATDMKAAGVMLKVGKNWIVHRDNFPPIAFAAVTGELVHIGHKTNVALSHDRDQQPGKTGNNKPQP